jgi:hypothetical protein
MPAVRAEPYDFVFQPKHVALLIIDMQWVGISTELLPALAQTKRTLLESKLFSSCKVTELRTKRR